MRSDFEGFIETFESPNTIKVIKSLRKICEYDYANCRPLDIQEVILSMKPNSPKAITTIVYVLGLYAKYLENDDMCNIVNDLDRSALWAMAKPNAGKKLSPRRILTESITTLRCMKNTMRSIYRHYSGLYMKGYIVMI